MSYHGQRNWPPRWTQRQGSLLKPVQGEVGVLKYVYSNHGSDSCYLVIEHEKESYIACLMCDDAVFAEKVVGTPAEQCRPTGQGDRRSRTA